MDEVDTAVQIQMIQKLAQSGARIQVVGAKNITPKDLNLGELNIRVQFMGDAKYADVAAKAIVRSELRNVIGYYNMDAVLNNPDTAYLAIQTAAQLLKRSVVFIGQQNVLVAHSVNAENIFTRLRSEFRAQEAVSQSA